MFFFFLKVTDSKNDIFAKGKDKVFIKTSVLNAENIGARCVAPQKIMSCKARRISALKLKLSSIYSEMFHVEHLIFVKKELFFIILIDFEVP